MTARTASISITGYVLTAISVLLMAAGCAVQKESVSPPVEIPDSFSETGNTPPPNKWWAEFNDPRLNALIDSAMQDNFTIRMAFERLRAAQAVTDRTAASLFPDLEATGGGNNIVIDNLSDDVNPYQQSFELGLTSVYELDLWGRIRSSVDAEEFRAGATLADFQTAVLTLTAEITRTWMRLADAKSQVELIDQQIETNQTVLQLLKNRLQTQQVQGVDILRQEQLIESTREQRVGAETRVKTLENQLAVLTGNTPQMGAGDGPEALPDPPALPDTGVPLDLVERRPDVQSAFYQLMAADRDLASAISNQYPRITLSLSANTQARDAGNLFEAWALSFAGNLVAPIFYGGELRAEVNRNEAVKQQRLYEYGQTVLVAFREVEDALIRETQQKAVIRSIERQAEFADRAYRQLRLRYLNGDANYLDVITALNDIQQLRRDLLSARLLLVEFRISLYRALAGSLEFDSKMLEADAHTEMN